MKVEQKCRDCDFRPGEGICNLASLRAAMCLYADIANAHAWKNPGHRVTTAVDGNVKRTTVFLLGGEVIEFEKCDDCGRRFPSSAAFRWEDIVLCPECGPEETGANGVN
jgi:hypothetical protein